MSTSVAERTPTHVCGRPSLETGDHLTSAEFHARYLRRPDIHKAELVNGVVYVASPTRTPDHGIPHNRLSTRLGVYSEEHPGTRASTESTLRQESDDEVRPDVVLFLSRKAGGTAWLDSDHYLRGAPELVAEVAASSVSYDLHEKKALYQRIGVQEYIVWRVGDEAIDWWELADGTYRLISPDEHGVVHSRVFEGLSLDVQALIAAAREAMEDLPE